MTGRVHTKDGNAESGLDYIPLSKLITIERDEDRCCFEIEILYDKLKVSFEFAKISLEYCRICQDQLNNVYPVCMSF